MGLFVLNNKFSHTNLISSCEWAKQPNRLTRHFIDLSSFLSATKLINSSWRASKARLLLIQWYFTEGNLN